MGNATPAGRCHSVHYGYLIQILVSLCFTKHECYEICLCCHHEAFHVFTVQKFTLFVQKKHKVIKMLFTLLTKDFDDQCPNLVTHHFHI